MEVVKLNKKSTLLLASTCPTQCDTEAGGGGEWLTNPCTNFLKMRSAQSLRIFFRQQIIT